MTDRAGQLRSRLGRATRQWAGSVLVLALAATAALTAATAARRTDTAYRRAVLGAHVAHAYVSVDASQTGPGAVRALDALDRSDVVVDHGRFGGAAIVPVHNGELDERFNTNTATAYLPYDRRVGVTISRFTVLSGRLAKPDRAGEVVVNRAYADAMHAHVGDRVEGARIFRPEDFGEDGSPDPHRGVPVDLRVVGIVKAADEALSPTPLRVFTTPAFTRRFPTAPFYYVDLVVLRRGFADAPRLSAEVERLQPRFPKTPIFASQIRDGLLKVERAADPLVNGLWVLAALAFAVGVLLAGQAFARVITYRAADHAILRAVGMTRAQRLRADLSSALRAVVLAALIALVGAWLLSPLTAVGAAGRAEPHPGHVVNVALDLLAFAAIALAGVAAVLPAAVRQASSTELPGQVPAPGRSRPALAVRTATSAHLGVPAVVGTQLAFEPGRGATATPVMSVLASLVLIVATVTATVAFGVNLDHLVGTKSLYGWNWDAAGGDSFASIPKEQQVAAQRAPGLTALAGVATGRVTIGRVVVPGVGFDQLRGEINPTLVRGRLPTTAGEILLGEKTLRAVHAHVGAVVVGRVNGHGHRLRVVGVASVPALGTAEFTEAGMGTGVIGAASLWDRGRGGDGTYSYLLFDYGASGPTPAQLAALRQMLSSFGCTESSCLLTDLRPNEIDGFRGARGLPAFVGVVLLLLLAATIGHALLSTLRRRRGDLAVLRALGCTPRQITSAMRWQALMLMVAALVVGIPAGLVANRIAWTAFANRFGVVPEVQIPVALLAAGGAAIVGLTLALATVAGLGVARPVRPADA